MLAELSVDEVLLAVGVGSAGGALDGAAAGGVEEAALAVPVSAVGAGVTVGAMIAMH